MRVAKGFMQDGAVSRRGIRLYPNALSIFHPPSTFIIEANEYLKVASGKHVFALFLRTYVL